MLGGASRSETCRLLGTGESGVSSSQERSCHPLCPRPALSQDATCCPLFSVLVFLKICSFLGLLSPILSRPHLLCLLELFLVCLIPGGCSGLGDSAPPRCTHSTLRIDSKSD